MEKKEKVCIFKKIYIIYIWKDLPKQTFIILENNKTGW